MWIDAWGCFEERDSKLGLKERRGEENLNISYIYPLNSYPGKLNNIFKVINCYNCAFWWRNYTVMIMWN